MRLAETGSETPPFHPEDVWKLHDLLADRRRIAGLSITPLGGLQAIGGSNCWLLEYDDQQLLLDCGQKVSETVSSDLPASYYPYFAKIDPRQLRGVILSHGHYDHVASLPKLVSDVMMKDGRVLNVWGTQTTLLVVRRIFENTEVDWSQWVNFHQIDATDESHYLGNKKETIEIGHFTIFPFPVLHSIPGSLGYLVYAGERSVCYPGDFKYVRSDWKERKQTSELFQLIGRQLIDVLILDSTGVDRDGYTLSVSGVIDEFAKIFQDPDMQRRRIYVSTFASDVEILQEIADLAQSLGKKQVIAQGASMVFFCEQFGIIPTNPTTNPPVVFITGCQAESDAALTRLSLSNGDEQLCQDDVVIISARAIPDYQGKVEEMIERLRRIVYRVITVDDCNIHISGHGSQQDLLQAIRDLCPRIVLPCHGRYSNLRQLAEIARSVDTGRDLTIKILKEAETLTV